PAERAKNRELTTGAFSFSSWPMALIAKGRGTADLGSVAGTSSLGLKTVIAVIFEVWPAEGRKADYLDYPARLRGELEHVDGFISVERFQSLADPDKLPSLSR